MAWGSAEERAHQTQLLVHAPRELSGRDLHEFRESGDVQELLALSPVFLFSDPVKLAEEIEMLADREIRIKALALRHVGDPLPDAIQTRFPRRPDDKSRSLPAGA